MDLSVVVPTLNDRDLLVACLDSIGEHAPDAEVVVVNGPSTDGTTGMVRERSDVAELVEIADRNLNVGRNAGVAAATGDVVALLDCHCRVDVGWRDALSAALADGGDVVTGPIRKPVRAGLTSQPAETRSISGRDVSYFRGGNVAFRRPAIEALDGFDEYLETGAARDAAHRLAGMGFVVSWNPAFAVLRDDDTDREPDRRNWGTKYRSLTYRMVKNYGPRPTVFARTVSHALADSLVAGKHVMAGDIAPSRWVGNGKGVLSAVVVGSKDGVQARLNDRSPTRNPNGISSRSDRVIERYDMR